MPVKATKALEAVKSSTIITTYVSGAPVAPAAGHISIYSDLLAPDQHRQLETIERYRDMKEIAREQNYSAQDDTRYWSVPVWGTKRNIADLNNIAILIPGVLGMGIEEGVFQDPITESGRNSLLIDTCIQEIIDWMREQDRVTV